MMDVPLDEPTYVFCDNELVVKNTAKPESTNKKGNAIAHHKARESIAVGIIKLAKEDGETNLSDILTKLLPGPRMKQLIARILW